MRNSESSVKVSLPDSKSIAVDVVPTKYLPLKHDRIGVINVRQLSQAGDSNPDAQISHAP
jgi:hypothetical protein